MASNIIIRPSVGNDVIDSFEMIVVRYDCLTTDCMRTDGVGYVGGVTQSSKMSRHSPSVCSRHQRQKSYWGIHNLYQRSLTILIAKF